MKRVIVYLLLNTIKDKVLLFDFFRRLSAAFSDNHVSLISINALFLIKSRVFLVFSRDIEKEH